MRGTHSTTLLIIAEMGWLFFLLTALAWGRALVVISQLTDKNTELVLERAAAGKSFEEQAEEAVLIVKAQAARDAARGLHSV